MAEKVGLNLSGRIAALSLIVTLTSATLAEVDVGALPQPRYQVSQTQAALTDDDLRAILLTSGMPYFSRTFAHHSSRHLMQNYPTILKQSTGLSG